jgi:5'-nucleotidase
MVTGEDVWDINAGESVYYEYSRYNANAADLYAVNPFRSSDHNPEIIGIDTGDNVPDPDVDTVQILATNDFHGRLLDDPGSAAAGAASMAGAVKELRAANPDTIFAAAGDLIGASTFESFIQNDEPTIDALNEAGLEVSSVGNHEFDKGYNDLLTRVMPHASWTYLGANVQFKDTENGHTAGDPALPETWCEALPNGRVVGFVGAVTEDLPTLVPASAIEDVVVTDIVDAVNENADKLKGPDGCGADGPADLVVELVHEGAATTAYSSVTDGSTFGKIVSGADENVDAIVSGHTHLAYNHKVPVPAWVTEGRTVTTRPVVSAGQYGSNLNRLQFEFAPGGGALVNIRQTVLQLKDYDADPATQAIVDDAVAFANVQGDVVLGDIANEFRRARRVGDDGQVVENRGGESTLGNLVAEMQRWKTGADIGLMNPGGLRADLLGNDGTPREVTYRQAANTQPFANTLVTMDLTGAQIKILLEQQWQRDADNNIPSRPFLRLGTSTGFTSTFDASRPEGDRITGMWLNGAPIVAGTTYQVSATSFLAGGGDNFKEFLNAHNVQDTGQTDLQAVVDYLAANAEHGVDVLPVDYAQHQVGVKVTSPDTAPYVAGNTVTFTVSSLAMTGAGDVQDNQVEVLLDGVQVGGPAAVTNTLQALPTDDAGTATVTFTLPADVPDRAVFTLHGLTTGTSIKVPVNTSDGLIDTTVTGTDQTIVYGQAGSVPVHVTPTGATGTVTLKDGSTVLGSTPLSAGEGSIDLAAGSLPLGPHALTLVYSGDGTYGGTTGSVNVTVTATPTITATPTPASVDVNGGTSSIAVTVTSDAVGDATGTVTASVGGNVVDTATLSGGSADLTVGPFASIGPKTITIDYSGDPGTEAGSTTTTVIVTKVAAVMTATPAPASVEVNGGTSTITVTVSAAGGPATGSVSVSVGGSVVDTKPLSGGQATVIVGPFSTVGEKTITASYAGNDTTAEASTTTTVTVTERSPTPTSVSATAAAMTYGSAGAVTATVTPSDTTGTVTVRDGATVIGSAEVEGGVAEVTIPGTALEPGNHTLSVTYGGDAEHRSSTTTVVVHVAKAASTTVATASPATVTVGVDTATVTVAVNGPGGVATGQVEARVDGTVVDSAALSEGMATLEVGPFSSVGTQVIEVRYRGSDRLAPSQDQTSVEVEAAPGPVKLDPTIKAFHFPTKVIVDKTRATLTVKVQADGVVPTGWVRVEVPGQDDRVAKLDDGKVKFRLARFGSVGDKVLTITYNGNAEVDSGQIEHVVTVSRKK